MSSNGRPFLGYSNWHWIAQNRRRRNSSDENVEVSEIEESIPEEVIVVAEEVIATEATEEENVEESNGPDFSELKESIEVASDVVESLKKPSGTVGKRHRKNKRR